MSEGVIREARVKFRSPRTILVVVKLDPESPHACMTALPDDGDPFTYDLAADEALVRYGIMEDEPLTRPLK